MTETQLSVHFPEDMASEVMAFLQQARTACLATVADDGRPHAANVHFAHDDNLYCYWVSSPHSAHSRYLAVRPDVAITIYGHDDRPMNIHGLQMHGRAEPITAEFDRHIAWNAFTAKFPDTADNPRFRELIDTQQFYRYEPHWLRWIDNRRGFGFKLEALLR